MKLAPKITSSILSLISSILILSSCGSKDTIDDSDVNEEKLYGRYEGHYDANTSKLSFYVQLRLGGSTGTTVRLSDTSQLKVGETAMTVFDGDNIPLNLSGTYYKLEQVTGSVLPEYTVKWTRTNGTVIENKIRIPQAVTLGAPVAGFSLVSGTSFPFTTIPVDGANVSDTLTCTLNSLSNPEANQNKSASVSCPVEGTATLVGAETAKLPLGPATAYTVRQAPTARPTAGHAAEGGIVSSSFKSMMISGSITAAAQ